MKNNTYEEIWNKINESKDILLTLHSGPDGDSLGSCTAMKYVLEKNGKNVRLVSKDSPSEALQAMSLAKEVEFGIDITEVDLSEFDLLICIDTSSPVMLGKYKPNYTVPKEIFVINIDHHPTNLGYGDLNLVEGEQPSACSVLMNLFKKRQIEFDPELSTRLLTGLCTDAGFFTFIDTAEKAIEQASFLIQNGGKYTTEVLAPILHSQSLNLMKYYSLLVMKLKFSKDRKYAYSITTAEEIKRLNLNKADVRLGPNHLQLIKDFDFIFTLAELDEEIKGSFRSQKGVDVSKFAKALNGGGHKAAAAFMLPKMPLDQAEKLVLDTIEKVISEKTS